MKRASFALVIEESASELSNPVVMVFFDLKRLAHPNQPNSPVTTVVPHDVDRVLTNKLGLADDSSHLAVSRIHLGRANATRNWSISSLGRRRLGCRAYRRCHMRGLSRIATGVATARPSSQFLMRLASAMRETFPKESSSTMITGFAAMVACITRQRPALPM
jgi:hypothetical protein